MNKKALRKLLKSKKVKLIPWVVRVKPGLGEKFSKAAKKRGIKIQDAQEQFMTEFVEMAKKVS